MMPATFFQKRPRRQGASNNSGEILSGLFHGMIVLVLIGVASYAFWRYIEGADGFRVKVIRVQGAERLDGSRIVWKSGVTTDDHILFLNERAVAAKVLELPYVKKCRVTRVFPDMVVIAVKERTPAASLMVNNRAFVIDEDAVVLDELPLSTASPEPFITEVPGLDVLEPGQKLDQPAVLAALAVLQAFQTTELAREVKISEIAARHRNDIRMYCDELPFEIRWGRGAFDTQARRLDALWKHKNKQLDFHSYCDLRWGADIACM